MSRQPIESVYPHNPNVRFFNPSLAIDHLLWGVPPQVVFGDLRRLANQTPDSGIQGKKVRVTLSSAITIDVARTLMQIPIPQVDERVWAQPLDESSNRVMEQALKQVGSDIQIGVAHSMDPEKSESVFNKIRTILDGVVPGMSYAMVDRRNVSFTPDDNSHYARYYRTLIEDFRRNHEKYPRVGEFVKKAKASLLLLTRPAGRDVLYDGFYDSATGNYNTLKPSVLETKGEDERLVVKRETLLDIERMHSRRLEELGTEALITGCSATATSEHSGKDNRVDLLTAINNRTLDLFAASFQK